VFRARPVGEEINDGGDNPTGDVCDRRLALLPGSISLEAEGIPAERIRRGHGGGPSARRVAATTTTTTMSTAAAAAADVVYRNVSRRPRVRRRRRWRSLRCGRGHIFVFGRRRRVGGRFRAILPTAATDDDDDDDDDDDGIYYIIIFVCVYMCTYTPSVTDSVRNNNG